MRASSEVIECLRILEKHLLDPDVRRSPRQVDTLLANDFVEFGSSGRIYDKAAVIEALQQDPGFDGPRTITEFSVRELSTSIMLVTYRIGETGTLRSSIWRSDGEHWEMVFHQGTRSKSK